MNTYTDKNGTEISVGALVRAKGSDVVRRVDQISDKEAASIHAVRIDGKIVSSSRWLSASTLEVIEEVAAN